MTCSSQKDMLKWERTSNTLGGSARYTPHIPFSQSSSSVAHLEPSVSLGLEPSARATHCFTQSACCAGEGLADATCSISKAFASRSADGVCTDVSHSQRLCP